MSTIRARSMQRILRIAVCALAGLALLAWLVVVGLRCTHPFELEWQEGGMLQEVQRVLAGRPLYAEPALDAIAFPYPPLFVWLGALAAKLCGASLFALRLVSIASSIGCFVFLFRIGARRGGSRAAGLYAAGLFAGCYGFAGAWLDVARVDALSLVLTLAALDLVDARRGVGAALGSGLLFAAAFLAKQTALAPAVCVLGVLAWRERRAALAFALALGVPLVASTWWLDAASGGWYRWYVFELLRGAPLSGEMAWRFWVETLLALSPALVLAWARRRTIEYGPTPIVPAAALGLWLSAWIARAHVGGWDNTLLPACLAAALLFGPALERTLALEARSAALGALLVVLQVLLVARNVRIPGATDRAAGEALVARLRAVEGEVWMPDHGYLAERAGKRPSAHAMGILDLLRGSDRGAAQRFVDALRAALASPRWSVLVLDQDWSADLPELAREWRGTPIPWPDADTFFPATGDRRRPAYWYVRR